MANIEFTLNKIDYELPDFLTIGDYMKVFKVKDLFEDEYLKAKVINLLTDCPIETLLAAENHKIDFIATTIFAMVPKPPYNLIDRFELDGVQYGYLPSYKEISFGEFADLDTLLTKKPEEIIENMHIIAAIMYRPIVNEKSKHNFKIQKYDMNTLDERAELFKKKLDVKFALGGQFFFTNFAVTYSNYTHQSLTQKILHNWEMIKFLWRHKWTIMKLVSKRDLDGMSFLIESQKIELRRIIKSLKKT
jgi:hypothetical protein